MFVIWIHYILSDQLLPWYSLDILEYFTSEDNPYRERLDEAISTLKNDKDADVRSYFNPPPSLSTCGESTAEYFDSDGEPIGDVSVSWNTKNGILDLITI